MTCQSSAPKVVCTSATPAEIKIARSRHRDVPVIVALGYQKSISISNRLEAHGRVHDLDPRRAEQYFKSSFDSARYFAKNRKCFCLLDVSAASGLHCSCWFWRRYPEPQLPQRRNFQSVVSGG